MAIIIRQSLEYLVVLGELPYNHFAEFKIKSSLFTPVIPKEAKQEVFTEDEEKKLKALAATELAEHTNHTAALAVLINFSLGLRVGEHVALKWKEARKTALTKVANNPNIHLNDAMEFAGHRDVKTFINHYCFSRYSDEQKRQELEKTLNV